MEYYKFINVTSFYNDKAEFEKLESVVREAVSQIDLPYDLEIEIDLDAFSEEDASDVESKHGSSIYVQFDYSASYEICSFVLDVIKELIEENDLDASYDIVTSDPNFDYES
jgi:hypothetical protein